MLVISRKKNEEVIIGGHDGIPEVRVVLVEIRGDKVRLGFEGGREVLIDRLEVRRAKIRDGQFNPNKEESDDEDRRS